jgi:kynurenine formamidase
MVDLSHHIESGTITYPGLPGPVISDYMSREDSRHNYAEGTEFQIGRIDMVANTGTYLDTPFHRYPDGHDLAGLTLERVADLDGVCLEAGAGGITAGLLEGVDVSGRAVLFHTGWDRHWGTDSYGDPEHPYLMEAAAELLVTEAAALVGIDSVNIDDTRTGARPAHTRLLAAGIPIVEHLTNLESLVGSQFRFFAVPPRVRGMGTFPVRAFAIQS